MSEKLNIVYRLLQELSPYVHNARTHSPEQVTQLVESIKQFGWTNPVLIDEKGEIIAGHGRVMAAEALKMDSVPVIVLSGLTDDQKKAYRLADNRLPMSAGWDEDLLRMELSDLINADFDISLTGFCPTEIDELLTDVLPGTANEDEPYTTKIDTPVYEPSGDEPDIRAKLGKFGVEILLEDKAAARRELIKLIMATKGSSAGGATDSRNDLELEGLRLRNEKLRTEIENLKKGVGGENNEIIIHNSLPMPGVDNVD
ncbi:ParB-like protein [Cooperia oncophora]